MSNNFVLSTMHNMHNLMRWCLTVLFSHTDTYLSRQGNDLPLPSSITIKRADPSILRCFKLNPAITHNSTNKPTSGGTERCSHEEGTVCQGKAVQPRRRRHVTGQRSNEATTMTRTRLAGCRHLSPTEWTTTQSTCINFTLAHHGELITHLLMTGRFPLISIWVWYLMLWQLLLPIIKTNPNAPVITPTTTTYAISADEQEIKALTWTAKAWPSSHWATQ